MKNYYVYFITNWNNAVLYIGVTNNLQRRVFEHKNKIIDGFTKRYNLTKLVHVEQITDIQAAITREKELKGWRREKKDKLIELHNPSWDELDVK